MRGRFILSLLLVITAAAGVLSGNGNGSTGNDTTSPIDEGDLFPPGLPDNNEEYDESTEPPTSPNEEDLPPPDVPDPDGEYINPTEQPTSPPRRQPTMPPVRQSPSNARQQPRQPTLSPIPSTFADDYDWDLSNLTDDHIPPTHQDPFGYQQLKSRMYEVVVEMAKLRKAMNNNDAHLYNNIQNVDARVSRIVKENLEELKRADKDTGKRIDDVLYNMGGNFTSVRDAIEEGNAAVTNNKIIMDQEDDKLKKLIEDNSVNVDKRFVALTKKYDRLFKQSQQLIQRNFQLTKQLEAIKF